MNSTLNGYKFIIAVIIFFLVSSSILLIRPGALDDLSFLRFSSFAIFNKETAQQSWQDVKMARNSISPDLYVKYGLRLGAITYYPLLSLFIRVAEYLPSFSPYQSAVMSLIIIQLISFIILLFLLKKKFPSLFIPAITALVLSLFPWKNILFKDLFKLIPFNLPNFYWFNGTAKNSMLLLFFALLLIVCFKSQQSSRKFWLWISLCALLMFSFNYPFSLMLLALFTIGLGIKFCAKKMSATWHFFVIFAVLSLLFFISKFFIYKLYSNELAQRVIASANIEPILWFIEILAVIYFWRKVSKGDTEIINWGNFILPMFLFFSSLSIGLSILPNDEKIHYTGNKLLTAFLEFSSRTMGISYMLFWIMVASLLFVKFGKNENIYKKSLILIALIALCFQIKTVDNNFEKNKNIIFFSNCEIDGRKVYSDENCYYQKMINLAKHKND